jgi:hypothetical protein
MIKRDVTETIYEYDKEGKLIRKTITETHEEDNNVTTSVPYTYRTWPPEITCHSNPVTNQIQADTVTLATKTATNG